MRYFSEKQLEALLALHSEREISKPVRRAVRLHNNGGWSQSGAGRVADVRAASVSEAFRKLKRAHEIIMSGYSNYIDD